MTKYVGSLERESYPSPHLPGSAGQHIIQCVKHVSSYAELTGHAVISYYSVLEINGALAWGIGKCTLFLRMQLYFHWRMQFSRPSKMFACSWFLSWYVCTGRLWEPHGIPYSMIQALEISTLNKAGVYSLDNAQNLFQQMQYLVYRPLKLSCVTVVMLFCDSPLNPASGFLAFINY